MEPFVIPLLLVPQLTNTGCRPVYLNTVYTSKFVCRSAPFYIPFRQCLLLLFICLVLFFDDVSAFVFLLVDNCGYKNYGPSHESIMQQV